MESYWNRFLETRILKSTGSGPENAEQKWNHHRPEMERKRMIKPEDVDMENRLQLSTTICNPLLKKHNLDLDRSLFLTVTFYLQSFEERERCYVVR